MMEEGSGNMVGQVLYSWVGIWRGMGERYRKERRRVEGGLYTQASKGEHIKCWCFQVLV